MPCGSCGEVLKVFYHIRTYGRGGHLGHVTKLPQTNICHLLIAMYAPDFDLMTYMRVMTERTVTAQKKHNDRK